MILFFDRNVGTRIPKALQSLRLPIGIEFHQDHFPQNAPDDSWLPVVGTYGWFVIGQDYNFHSRPAELYALKSYEVGCFYLWGSTATSWDKLRVFAKAYDAIVEASEETPRPFVFRIDRNGRLRRILLP